MPPVRFLYSIRSPHLTRLEQPDRHRGFLLLVLLAFTVVGCSEPEPIVTYNIPTEIPEQLRAGKDRMLAVMFPKGEDVWYVKVTGPEKAVELIEPTLRKFVEQIEFVDGVPDLKELPEGWRRGGKKRLRFATIDVDTPTKQLGISISKLSRREDWGEQVQMDVNRWRRQLGLDDSDAEWADGELMEVTSADLAAIWVDLVGDPSKSTPMTPPFAGAAPFAGIQGSGTQASGAQGQSATPPVAASGPAAKPDERLKFERPEGWRDGRMTSMRMAAFNVGSEDSPAELTVIPAGGDLRGNVARWLGQVRGGNVPDDVVDQALADAIKVSVDGRSGQRFFLAGEDPEQGTAIDATIVPMEGGMSLFVKMTGPAETVLKESDAIASFLGSLKLNL